MEPEVPKHLPVDDRLFRWLVVQISRMGDGSLYWDIRNGKLQAIYCSGSRAVRTPDDLVAPTQPPCP